MHGCETDLVVGASAFSGGGQPVGLLRRRDLSCYGERSGWHWLKTCLGYFIVCVYIARFGNQPNRTNVPIASKIMKKRTSMKPG